MTKDEVIAAIKRLAEKLGRAPSRRELLQGKKVTQHELNTTFGSYREALAACGLAGRGFRIALDELFRDWATVARKLGKIPTLNEYVMHGRYSQTPLIKHFGGWLHVPAGLLSHAREHKLEGEWNEVVELLAWHAQPGPGSAGAARSRGVPTIKPRILQDRPIYGMPFLPLPLLNEPVNETCVIFLFGALAMDLGFRVLRLQTGFPDGEAFREIAPGQCQRVKIEFEFESRNFLAHTHPVKGCDLIVCWNHNWPECPLEVIELKSLLPKLP